MARRKGIPQGLRFKVFRRDNFVCRYCGKGSPDVELHLDHVEPHSRGGSDTEDNLITACSRCNIGKGCKPGVVPPSLNAGTVGSALVGMYGHTYTDDGARCYQFKILADDGQEVKAQLYSWFAGEKTNVEVWEREYVKGPNVKLYATHSAWIAASGYDEGPDVSKMWA